MHTIACVHYKSKRMNGRVVRYRKPFHAAKLGDDASITGFMVWMHSGKKGKSSRTVQQQQKTVSA